MPSKKHDRLAKHKLFVRKYAMIQTIKYWAKSQSQIELVKISAKYVDSTHCTSTVIWPQSCALIMSGTMWIWHSWSCYILQQYGRPYISDVLYSSSILEQYLQLWYMPWYSFHIDVQHDCSACFFIARTTSWDPSKSNLKRCDTFVSFYAIRWPQKLRDSMLMPKCEPFPSSPWVSVHGSYTHVTIMQYDRMAQHILQSVLPHQYIIYVPFASIADTLRAHSHMCSDMKYT